MSLKSYSVLRFGSYCCLLAGIAYILIVYCAFLSPDSIASYVTSPTYFEEFQYYEPIFVFLKWTMLAANLAMIGVVCAFHALRRDENEGLMSWLSTIAIIGFGIGMYQSVQDLSMVPYLAEQYSKGDALIREVIIALGVANPMVYVISLGLPGVWFIGVSWRALDNPNIPKHLILLGFLWGCGNITTVFAHAFVIIPLIKLVAYGALLFAPLWSISQALFLHKTAIKLAKKKKK